MPESLLREEFGRLVRDLRTELGVSQEEFAYRCRIHRTYMTHIERGTKMPSLLIVAKIANGLGIELSQLFFKLEERGFLVSRVSKEGKS